MQKLLPGNCTDHIWSRHNWLCTSFGAAWTPWLDSPLKVTAQGVERGVPKQTPKIHPDSSRFMIFPTWPRILLSHGYPRVSTSRWCPSETTLLPSFPLPQDANVRSMTSTGELENSSSTFFLCQSGGARLSTGRASGNSKNGDLMVWNDHETHI